MDTNYRPYQDSDRAAVANLFDEFQDHLASLDPLHRLRRMLGYGEHALETTLKQVREQDGAFYVADNGNQVIGFAVGLVEKLTETDLLGVFPSRPGRIAELYVHHDHRGQGIGSTLMSMVEDYLKTRGCDVVKVEVFAPNETAKNLYQKLGYAPRDIDNIKKL